MVLHRQPFFSWMRCLPAASLIACVAGCALPGQGNSADGPLEGLKPVTTASYQEHAIDEGPPKKIKDPATLKLHYAQWMEEIDNFPAAEANYNFVLQKDPKNVEAILGLARVNQATGSHAEAEAGFQKALTLSPKSTAAKHALGQFYVARERYAEALPLLREALRHEPSNKSYRFDLAVALARSGDLTAAFPHFSQSVGESTAHFNVAMILKSQGQFLPAERHLKQSLALKPEFQPAQQALAEIRPLVQSSIGSTARPRSVPRIQPAGHSRPAAAARPQSRQSRNQRAIGR